MKALKILMIAALAYVGIVAAFESLIGFFQPSTQQTLVITTFAPDGAAHDRVVARLESDGHLYVACNHWPRAWYKRALKNPKVDVTLGDTQGTYTAVPVSGAEHDRVEAANRLPLAFRILTGFPPRYFLRLDPR